MTKLTTTLFSLICIPLACLALEGDRVLQGWGADVSVSTTADYIDIEQGANTNSIANGTFATNTGWTGSSISNGSFAVTGGAASFQWTSLSTQTMIYTWTSATDPAPNKRYDVTFTLAGDVATTNKLKIIFGTDGTGSTSDWYVAAGTYTKRLTYATGSGDANTNFTMYGEADGIGTATVDNVIIRLAPEGAYVGQLYLSVGLTDLPAYVWLGGGSQSFADAYAAGYTICIDSNTTTCPIKVDMNNTGRKITKIYHRSASGTPTLKLRGW